VLLVKTESYEDSSPNREFGAGKFLSGGEKIIVAHVNEVRDALIIFLNKSHMRTAPVSQVRKAGHQGWLFRISIRPRGCTAQLVFFEDELE